MSAAPHGPAHPALRRSLFLAGTDTGVGKTWVATRLIAGLAADGLRVGVALRLLGPLVECLCLIALFRYGNRGRTLLGLPIEPFLYAGLACGLAMVIVGLLASRSATRRAREEA